MSDGLIPKLSTAGAPIAYALGEYWHKGLAMGSGNPSGKLDFAAMIEQANRLAEQTAQGRGTDGESYTVHVFCLNCRWGRLHEIPKGQPIEETGCPRCGCWSLKRDI